MLALVAGISCSSAMAKGKKDKKVEAPVKEVVVLSSKSDSLSYAAGQAHTIGLMQYVKTQLDVDSAYIQTFVEALRESLNLPMTPENQAKAAAAQISAMVNVQMVSKLKEQMGEFNQNYNDQLFKRGFMDAVDKDASIFSDEEASNYVAKEFNELKEAADNAKKAAGIKFLEENKTKPGVKTTSSGLQYKVIREGNGPIATKNADVEVKYEGKLIDGTIFDSSYQRNPQTTTFKPTQVIKGWTEALCMMPEGSEWELYIPQELGYGGRDTGSIPAFSTLIFKVEVVKVTPEKVETPAEETPAPKVVKKAVAKKGAAKK